MSPEAATLAWPEHAEALTEHLNANGTLDPTTGEPFDVRNVDWAIQQAMESAASAEEIARVPEHMTPYAWWAIGDRLAAALGLDGDQIAEVAP